MKKLDISYKKIAKYFVFLLLFILLANGRYKGFTPFSLGLFVALTYCRQSLILVSLMYLATSIGFTPTVNNAIVLSVSIIIINGAYFMHSKFKYPINMLYINLYAFISSLSVLAFISSDMLVDCLVSILLGQIFTYCTVILANAVLIRGLKYKVNADEMVACGVFFGVIGLSLYSAQILDFNFYFLVTPFLLLLSSFFNTSITLSLATVMGLGVTLATSNILFCATTSIWALAICMFKKVPYLAGLFLVFVDLLLGLYFKAYPSYSVANIVAICVGVLCFYLLPKNLRRYLSSTYGIVGGNFASKNIVNRSRTDVANKLNFISSVFYDMHYILTNSGNQNHSIDDMSKAISKEFAGRMCKNCKNRAECERILEGSTTEIFDKMMYSCLKRGKVTALDIPPFVASRCGSVDLVIKNIKIELKNYEKKLENESIKNKNKVAIASQMQSMSEVLKNVSLDISKTVKFDGNLEQKIIDELLIHNVVCFEAIVYNNKQKTEVSLVVRKQDYGKKILTKVVSKILKKPMIIKMNSVKEVSDSCFFELIEQPNYDVVFGKKVISRASNFVSGDSNLVRRISDDKVIIALSDGMGSGEKANEKSLATLAMIESFYKAGFTSDVILPMVNKLLTLTCDDDYATLDMCVLDLLTGQTDFIKMGACDGIIRQNNEYEVVSSSSLPMGIIDEAKVNVESRQLKIGDLVVIVSDGVSDSLSCDDIISLVEQASTNNPQVIAELIADSAISSGAKDDVSAVVARLFNKVA